MDEMAIYNQESSNPMKLKSVFSTSEMLSQVRRKYIEDSFSCTLFNQYRNAEFGPVAWECPEEHNMHVNSGSCILEIVDEKGNPKNSGVGNIVLTSLCNHAMPFIRYKIGDQGSCIAGGGYPATGNSKGMP